MTKKEYIERQAVIKIITQIICDTKVRHKGRAINRNIKQLPAADVQEVRHGKWKKVYKNDIATVYECTNCKHLTFGTSDYCICGAKMDKE